MNLVVGRSGRAGTLIAILVLGLGGVALMLATRGFVQRAGASAAARAAAREPSDAAGWYARGDDLLRRRTDPRGAAAAFKKAVELAPEMGEAHFGLGYTLLDLGDVDGAIAELESALSLAHEGAGWKKNAEDALVAAHLQKSRAPAK
jgi:tetratricopeptide (TPR) repeat protein